MVRASGGRKRAALSKKGHGKKIRGAAATASRSVAARAHVFLTLPAKLLVMVADPQSSLSGRIPLDDDRNRLLAVRLYHCVLLSAKLALSGCAVMCRHSCRNQSKHLPTSPCFPFLAGEFN